MAGSPAQARGTAGSEARLRKLLRLLATAFALASANLIATPAHCSVAGAKGASPLFIVKDGKGAAVIVSSELAGPAERRAAEDLAKYIKLMTGATLPIVSPLEAKATGASARASIWLGKAALQANPGLAERLQSIVKKKPFFRADGIALLRDGDKLYIAGANDESHYFAAAELLRAWGMRWFMPGDFGECAPEERDLAVGTLSLFYAPPFEARSIGVMWLGSTAGLQEFELRNMLVAYRQVPAVGHSLWRYAKGLAGNPFELPLTAPETMEQVARNVAPQYLEGKAISLGMDDGIYASNYPRDKELMALQWDNYSMGWAVTDPMLNLLNGVARRLREQYPASPAQIHFLVYSNMFLPPKRETHLEPTLFPHVAPIDIDPNHAMSDPQSPPKNEYREILAKWVKLAQGRVIIYDYDQGMLVWRDLPNPSHLAFSKDVKTYRDLGIIGFTTETRMALATTFTNLYLRSRLMWNPEEDVDALLDDFHRRFFGPAEAPMRAYWNAIFDAWRNTLVTEHEFFVAPAIYTPELVERLGGLLAQAEETVAPLRSARQLSRNEQLYLERLRFVRLGYETLKSYILMEMAAATQVDYTGAVAAGEAGLRARDALGQMNPAFTTARLEKGTAFWPGEVQQFRDLEAILDGAKGHLVAKLPLEWSFHRDKVGAGRQRGFLDGPVDLTFWNEHKNDYAGDARKDYPDQWETLRTDLYVQAQGVRDPDRQSYTGDLWYRTDIELSRAQVAERPHIRFPGLFNECEFYVNGREAGRRQQNKLWWSNDYRFEWDLQLGSFLQEGRNALALHCHNPHHMGGMFRRPFLYAPSARAEAPPP